MGDISNSLWKGRWDNWLNNSTHGSLPFDGNRNIVVWSLQSQMGSSRNHSCDTSNICHNYTCMVDAGAWRHAESRQEKFDVRLWLYKEFRKKRTN